MKQIQNYEINNSNKNGEEIEKYKKELKIKEEEIKNNLSKTSQIKEQFNRIIEATKEEYKNKLEKFERDLKKKVEEWKEKTKKEFEDKYNEKEKNYYSKFNELKNLIKNQKWNKNDANDNDNDYDSDSDNSNDIDDINNNEIREDKNEIIIENEIRIEKNEEYSYECINKRDLKLNIDEDDDFSKFEIALKNNGKNKWHKDTKLKIVGDSEEIKTKIINLKPQEPEETGVYRIDFNYLKEYVSGEYRMYLEFYSGGNNYGERLEMRVNTVKKEEVNKNIEKIKEFRNLFGFREKDYSNAFLLRKLKENNSNFEKAHNSIFKK